MRTLRVRFERTSDEAIYISLYPILDVGYIVMYHNLVNTFNVPQFFNKLEEAVNEYARIVEVLQG